VKQKKKILVSSGNLWTVGPNALKNRMITQKNKICVTIM